MDYYKKLQETVEYLMDDFKDLTNFEALSISVQLIKTQVISDGFLVNNQNAPVALEPIAMTLGYEKHGSNLLETLRSLNAE